MPKRNRHTGLSFILAIVLNIAIIIFLLSGLAGYLAKGHKATKVPKKTPEKHVVQAVAVDQAQVEKNIQAIQQARARQKQAEINWKNQLKNEAMQAEQQRQQALQHLRALKQQTSAEKSQAQAALARLQALQAQAKARLASLQEKQATLNEKNASIQQQLKQTQSKLQQQMSAVRKLELQRQLAKEQAKQKRLQQLQTQNTIARYKALIQNSIERQWLLPEHVDKNLSCELDVKLSPEGKVLSVNVARSSGNNLLDRSAVTAVLKASPLPVPQDKKLFQNFSELHLVVKPEGVIST